MTRMRGAVLSFTGFGLLAWLGSALLLSAGDPASEDRGAVFRVPVHGVVELGLAPFIERSVRTAERAGARAVILDIETPGGRVDAAEHIVDVLKDAAVPVYAFVNRRAFSAGALIALAADGIYMRPGSVMGAATPVDATGKKAPEKYVSAMRSEMRALAQARGLDPRVAEAMVDEDIEVPGLDQKGKLLTLTTSEAVRVGYAREVADWDALLAVLDLRGAPIRDMRVNWAERLVRFFTHPAVAPLLLSLGVLGLIIEFKTPAFGIAGAAGVVSLALFFGSHFIVGLAGWEELILLGVGLILIGVEMFVLPGFGIAGVAGIGAVLGSVFLSLVGDLASPEVYSQATAVSAVALVLVFVGAWGVLRALQRSVRLRRSGVMLGDATTREMGYLSAAVRADLIGQEGTAVTDLRPAGAAQVGEERLDVVAESSFIPSGTRIRIVSAEGNRLVVRPAP